MILMLEGDENENEELLLQVASWPFSFLTRKFTDHFGVICVGSKSSLRGLLGSLLRRA